MDVNLDFLKNVKLNPVEKLAPKRKSRKMKTPGDSVDLRVFANGAVYPSERFVKENNLEYQTREEIAPGSYNIKGNGLDVFASTDWHMWPQEAGQHYIFLAVVPKAYPKVSLFANTKYDEATHEPKSSVMDQTQTFGKKELVQMLADIYQVDWNVKEYVDLVLIDQVISNEEGVYHVPKLVSSGKNKGEHTFIRRDNIDIRPLVLYSDPSNIEVKDAEVVEALTEESSGEDKLPFGDTSSSEEGSEEKAQTTDWNKLGS